MAKLFIVPTPIGNLEDITLRALNVLKAADLILCEDTRTTKNLLQHYEIEGKRCMAYHIFNEHEQVGNYIRQIQQVETAALVSDAGTPGISDPGVPSRCHRPCSRPCAVRLSLQQLLLLRLPPP